MNGHPLELHLPGGIRAQYVPGSQPARYTVDGALCDIDVEIPDDLLAAGWCWLGSTLYQPYPGRDDGPGIGIATCTFPPPGWKDGYKTCFESAYTIERLRAEHEVARAMRPAKKARRRKAVTAPIAEPELEQAVLF